MHSHKATPDKINDKHVRSLLSINAYFGLVLYLLSKSFLHQFNLSAALGLSDRDCDGIRDTRRNQLFDQ